MISINQKSSLSNPISYFKTPTRALKSQQNEKWISIAKTALATGIISAFGLSFLAYQLFGKKEIIDPLTPILNSTKPDITNPIGAVLKVIGVLGAISVFAGVVKSAKAENDIKKDPLKHIPIPSTSNLFLQNNQEVKEKNQFSKPEFLKHENASTPVALLQKIKLIDEQFSKDKQFTKTEFNVIKDGLDEICNDGFKQVKSNEYEDVIKSLVRFTQKLINFNSNVSGDFSSVLIIDLIEYTFSVISKFDKDSACDIAITCINNQKYKNSAEKNFAIQCRKIVEKAFNDPEMKMKLAVACAKNATFLDLKNPYRDFAKKAWKDFKDDLPAKTKFLNECKKIKTEFCMDFVSRNLIKNFESLWNAYTVDLTTAQYDKDTMESFIPLAQEKIESFKKEKKISSLQKFYEYLLDSISELKDDQEEALKIINVLLGISLHTRDYETIGLLLTTCHDQYPYLKTIFSQAAKKLSSEKSNEKLADIKYYIDWCRPRNSAINGSSRLHISL